MKITTLIACLTIYFTFNVLTRNHFCIREAKPQEQEEQLVIRVGQVVYITSTGINGSVAQGVQQPYEISVITGVNETAINLEMNVIS